MGQKSWVLYSVAEEAESQACEMEDTAFYTLEVPGRDLSPDASRVIVDIPRRVLAGVSNILSQEATACLTLQQVSPAHTSCEAT